MRSDCIQDVAEFAEHTANFASLAIHSLDPRVCTIHLQLWREVLGHHPQNFLSLCQALAASDAFHEMWTGRSRASQDADVTDAHGESRSSIGRAPFVLPRLRFLENVLSLQDIAAGLAAGVAAGDPIPAALGLIQSSGEKINSELPPITKLSELEEILGFGTVFLNAASKRWRAAAALCRTIGSVLGFPANINVYVTAPGRDVSTPVHTDHHDVFVLQTQGVKRWKVYAPPMRTHDGPHPCHRGKHEDTITSNEIGEPIIDVTLRPGEVLFVPMGFAHATSTTRHGSLNASVRTTAEASVHLTLGISVADCGLSYNTLRTQLLLELGLQPAPDEGLDDHAFWSLQAPLHVGCLAPSSPDDHESGSAEMLVDKLLHLILQIDSARNAFFFKSNGVALRTAGRQIVDRWLRIWRDLLGIYDEGYAEVVTAAGNHVVATNLGHGPNFNAFHKRNGHSGVAPPDKESLSLDPAIDVAVRSATGYCAFLRKYSPQIEMSWTCPCSAANLNQQIST